MKNNDIALERNERREKIMEQSKTMTLAEVGKAQTPPISRARVSQIIGVRQRREVHSTRLLDVYRFIVEHHREFKFPPSIAEIGREFPTDKGEPRESSVVHSWLTAMVDLDMIDKSPRISRSIVPKPLNKKNPRIRAMLEMEMENQNVK